MSYSQISMLDRSLGVAHPTRCRDGRMRKVRLAAPLAEEPGALECLADSELAAVLKVPDGHDLTLPDLFESAELVADGRVQLVELAAKPS